MKLCPKCGSLGYFNSYFNSFMCNTCEYTWKEKEGNKNSPLRAYVIKRHSRIGEEKIAQCAN